MKDLLKRAYDPEVFRENGHELIDFLADYLGEAASADSDLPANPWKEPALILDRWRKDHVDGNGDPLDLFKAVVTEGVHLHSPRFMGHQICPTLPVAALAGFLGDFLNNGMGVYEMGGPGTAIERLVIDTVAKAMGMNENAGGYMTSGGTLANLTALLAARSIKVSQNVWVEGTPSGLALLVSEQAHYCVDRAARIMGWGEAGIIKVPVDARYRMRTDLLEGYFLEAKEKGLEVISVIGSACTTATGAFDDLSAIADFCGKHDLWFHVDGAHGAPLVFSEKYRHVVKGIERADSVAMDFHKMLMTPAISTALIFRRHQDSYRTFSQRADYLFGQQGEEEWYNLARRTFECTKVMMGLKVYSILSTYGTELFDAYVTQVNDLGGVFSELIGRRKHFELAVAPQCNIVCYRYREPGMTPESSDRVNESIRQALLEDGGFYIVKTQLNEEVWLRSTLSNPFTAEKDLNDLLDKIETFVAQMERAPIA